MSELSSAFPVSGGLYFWSFMLAGKNGPFASWIVGWLNLLGQVTSFYAPVTLVSLIHLTYTPSDHKQRFSS